jgi:hypothetical protein
MHDDKTKERGEHEENSNVANIVDDDYISWRMFVGI